MLRFISIAHLNDQNDVKIRIWHEVLSFMLKRKSNIFRIQIDHLLMKWLTIIRNLLQTKKMLIRCVDARIRRCVLIIIDFICNYEEQILITNIKNKQQCSICQMSFDERENLRKNDCIAFMNLSKDKFVINEKKKLRNERTIEFMKWEISSESIIWLIYMRSWWWTFFIN